jgi:hypothetical protein
MYEVYDETQDLVIYTTDTRDSATDTMLYYLGVSVDDYYLRGIDEYIYVRRNNGETI